MGSADQSEALMGPAKGVLNAFLRAFLDDRDGGRILSSAEYEARWPDFSELIAAEYRELTREESGSGTGRSKASRRAPSQSVQFGRYELLRLIGCGGQASVFFARDDQGGKAAIKILSGIAVAQPESLARFRREAEVIASLDHPGICRILEYGEQDGSPFIAMEYVAGEPLTAAIPRWAAVRESTRSSSDGRDPTHRILEVIEQTALALHAAHEAGVVHRDIKPSNIMLRPDGTPVILDFGIARGEEGGATTLTHTGEVIGTPLYMAPEQIAPTGPAPDGRADVFSLGVTLYEALTAQRPFQAPTYQGILELVQLHDPPPPSHCAPTLPRDLDLVLAMALEKDRARRYASALEFAKDLGRIRRGERVAAVAPSAWSRARKWIHRHPRKAMTGLAVVVALSAATALGFYLRAEAVSALADYRRLADAATVLQLKMAADELWPPVPEMIPRYEAWLEQAEAVARELPHHEAELRELRARGSLIQSDDEPHSILGLQIGDLRSHAHHLGEVESRFRRELPEADSTRAGLLQDSLRDISNSRDWITDQLTIRTRWSFAAAADQSRHDIVMALVNDLRNFLSENRYGGGRFDVLNRLQFVVRARQRLVDQDAAAWQEAIALIADPLRCPRYRGLRIRPQFGLLPLGLDPQSGLYEFMDLYTADPAFDFSVPARGSDGTLRRDSSFGVVLVLVPGGRAYRGAKVRTDDPPFGDDVPIDENSSSPGLYEPVELVPYLIAKYEMTRGEWWRLTGMRPSQHPGGEDDQDYPLDCVTWLEADLWLRRCGLDLPTGYQWEYAARAGSIWPWHTGRGRGSLEGYANLAGSEFTTHGEAPIKFEPWNDGSEPPTVVGSYLPNAFGLHDIHGNVFEWVRDAYRSSVFEARAGDGDNLQFSSDATRRLKVQKGGSYRRDAIMSKVAFDLTKSAEVRDYESGIRAIRTLRR